MNYLKEIQRRVKEIELSIWVDYYLNDALQKGIFFLKEYVTFFLQCLSYQYWNQGKRFSKDFTYLNCILSKIKKSKK
jgi:hypothetical protein